MERVNSGILEIIAQQAVDEMNTMPDFNLMPLDVKIRKQREVIMRAMVRYHRAIDQERTTGDKIQDLISEDWRVKAFDIFWNAYGKKVQYAAVQRKWGKLKRAEIDAILENVESFVQAHSDKQFRPHPLTYLNQRRWEDELPDIKKKSTKILNTEGNSWSWT